MPFSERTPIERGFAETYARDVQPQLNEFEFDRQAMLKKTRLTFFGAVAAILAIAGAAYAIFGSDSMPFAPFLALFAIVGAHFTIWGSAKAKWSGKIKDIAIPAICDHVGNLTHTSSGGRFSIRTMENLRLLPKHDNAYLSNLLDGTHNDAPYQMVQARLTETHHDSENRRRTTTVFQGLLFRIELPHAAPGRIALMRDRGGIGNKLAETFSFGSTRSLPKVTFDDTAFEAAFEVYADQPDAARAFLSQTMRAALLSIGDTHGQGQGAKAFVAGFERNAFYIALKRDGGIMKMGDLKTPVDQIEEDLHGIFNDIALSHCVVERLTLARQAA